MLTWTCCGGPLRTQRPAQPRHVWRGGRPVRCPRPPSCTTHLLATVNACRRLSSRRSRGPLPPAPPAAAPRGPRIQTGGGNNPRPPTPSPPPLSATPTAHAPHPHSPTWRSRLTPTAAVPPGSRMAAMALSPSLPLLSFSSLPRSPSLALSLSSLSPSFSLPCSLSLALSPSSLPLCLSASLSLSRRPCCVPLSCRRRRERPPEGSPPTSP